MASAINPMAKAWLDAAEDLGIRVVHPFFFISRSGATATTQGVYLPDFGGARGALLVSSLDSVEVRSAADDTDYFRSRLFPSYDRYSRKLFVDTLNDWGWFGPLELRPPWFTGAPWS